MFLRSETFPQLARHPVELRVRPAGDDVDFEFVGSVPVRAVVFLGDDNWVQWRMWKQAPGWHVQPDPEGRRLTMSLSFRPWADPGDDEVQVTFAFLRRRIAGPGPTVLPAAGSVELDTGTMIVLAHLPAHNLRAAVLLLAKSDTETRRNRRWRLKPDLAVDLPGSLTVLGSGHQDGDLFAFADDVRYLE